MPIFFGEREDDKGNVIVITEARSTAEANDKLVRKIKWRQISLSDFSSEERVLITRAKRMLD